MHLAKKSFKDTFSMTETEFGFRLVYDVCHNIAKIEEHNINGKKKKFVFTGKVQPEHFRREVK